MIRAIGGETGRKKFLHLHLVKCSEKALTDFAEGKETTNATRHPPFALTILRLFSAFDKVVCKIFFRGIACSSSHYPCGAPLLKKTTCTALQAT
jgi:hypothetical protein